MMQLKPLQSDDCGCVVDFPLFYPLVCLFSGLPTLLNPEYLRFIRQTMNTCRGVVASTFTR
ncbi:hypothetical protein KCP77_05595 [Salmonella enterica subsp. enterica]|nr:hypothetical protein KCP77_05595 [Salmonella enterica subsp. enterica]